MQCRTFSCLNFLGAPASLRTSCQVSAAFPHPLPPTGAQYVMELHGDVLLYYFLHTASDIHHSAGIYEHNMSNSHLLERPCVSHPANPVFFWQMVSLFPAFISRNLLTCRLYTNGPSISQPDLLSEQHHLLICEHQQEIFCLLQFHY